MAPVAVFDFVSRADTALFERINGAWSCRLFDAVLPVLTDLHKNRFFDFVIAPAALGAWVWAQRGRAVRVVVAMALVIGMSDVFAFRMIKHFFHRPRPEWAGVAVVLRRPSQRGWSFPSNHAANAFAGATLLGSVYPAMRAPFYAAAALVAYSRVYVGMHYPLEAAAGAVLGALIGWLGAAVFRRIEKRWPP